MTGTEVRTLTLKSYGLELSVSDEPGDFTRVELFDSENIQKVSMQLDETEVRHLIGFLKATLE